MTKLYFAQPLVRAASPDFEYLQNLPAKYTIDTPGGSLAGALQYYKIEAYARKTDRDAACGMTSHPDIKYAPIAAASAEATDDIGCGYPIGHSLFASVIDPVFSKSAERLIKSMRAAGRDADGPIAVESILIARTLYFMEANSHRDHVEFQINGLAVFEKADRTTIDATCAFLEQRLRLYLSPTMPKRRAN